VKQWISIAFLSLTIAACNNTGDRPIAPSEISKNCRIVPHLQGETEICGEPQRIVVLGPSVLEPLLALGGQPVGFADYTAWHRGDYNKPSQQIPYLGHLVTTQPTNLGTAFEPSIEAIVGLQPDLILATQSNVDGYETLSAIAPTLLLSRNDDDSETRLRAIAKALDRPQQAEELIAERHQNVAKARDRFASLAADRPKMLLLGAIDWEELYLGDRNYGLCSSLLQELGFELVTPPGLNPSVADSPIPISHETLSQLNDADSAIVFTGNLAELNGQDDFETHQVNHIKRAWQEDAIAQSLDASKAGRVYFIPGYLCRAFPGTIGTELYLEELKEQLLSVASSALVLLH